jgi:RNA polymerase sigma-70 factor (ECF subfamily)
MAKFILGCDALPPTLQQASCGVTVPQVGLSPGGIEVPAIIQSSGCAMRVTFPMPGLVLGWMEALNLDIDRYRDELQAFAYRLLKNHQEAEDCVQNVFLAALRSTAPPENLRAWLYRVTHNLAVNQIRRRHLLPPTVGVERTEAEPRGDDELLERALSGLPEDQRLILLLRYTHGLAFEEIGHILGIPVGTAKVYAGRGLTALRKTLRRNS